MGYKQVTVFFLRVTSLFFATCVPSFKVLLKTWTIRDDFQKCFFLLSHHNTTINEES